MFIEAPVEPVGGTRRRPIVTAQISATPVQDLSPFPESGQSALTSHRPSRCGGGTVSELRFSTFLSPVYSAIYLSILFYPLSYHAGTMHCLLV